MIPRLIETIKESFEANLTSGDKQGNQHDSQVVVVPASMAAVAQLVSQVFVGDKYGRDKKWTSTVMDFAHGIMIYDIFLRWFPKTLRRYISELMPTRRRVNRLRQWLRDDILYLAQQDDSNVTKEVTDTEVASRTGLLLPMLVQNVRAKPNYKNADDTELVRGVTARVAVILLAAIDTTSLTFSQVLFDLVSQPRSRYIDPIVAQIRQVLSENEGMWDLKALGHLNLLDSFIKESQRLHPIQLTISGRNVLPEDGHTFRPSKGDLDAQSLHVPRDALLKIPQWGVHLDPENYSDPETFYGFRFAQDSEPPGQLNDKFLGFGLGMIIPQLLIPSLC